MAINTTDFKPIKEKKLDKQTILKVSKHILTGRIFVEFSSQNPHLLLQKNFQDSFEGRKESENFAKSIKNVEQLKKYFGIIK